MWKTLLFVTLVCSGAGAYWYMSTYSAPKTASGESVCKHHFLTADCPFCTPARIAKMGECREHNVPEALCWLCNSKLIDAFKIEKDWCGEHDCPESRCRICNPAAASAPQQAHNSDDGHAHGPGDEHAHSDPASQSELNNVPRSQRAPAAACRKSDAKVELAGPEIAQQIGLTYTTVNRRPITQTTGCNVEIAYDGNHFAQLSSRVPGVIREVRADLGSKVAPGDVLAIIDAPELAMAKAELLQSLSAVALHQSTVDRHVAVANSGAVSRRESQEEENRLQESRISESRARRKLATLGLSDVEIDSLVNAGDTSSLLSLTAPFAGEIVERSAVLGETVETARMLFQLADTSRMWAVLDVSEPRAQLAVGQSVVVQIDGLDGDSFPGKLTWVSTKIDPRTRTLKARAEVDNAEHILKANMFGHATVTLHEWDALLLVPKTAVQWDGCCNIVFVKESERVFQPRKVRLGLPVDDFREVRDGLAEGDIVVDQGSFLLKAELLKGEIGDGCCADHSKK